MLKKTPILIVLIVIISLGTFFNYNYINEFPSTHHIWAQTDRYALANGFVNNNLNILKPETFVFNHQFPDNWKTASKESITAVDFPIHDYVPAIFMKILGNTSPWIFRIYILLYSFIGLFFLFKVSMISTKDFYKSLIVVIFAATSPVFIYYQSGFLPTIPCLANVFIGIYFYTKFLLKNNNKHFYLSIAFLTLATLSRLTFAIPLIAIFGYELLRIIQHKTSLKPKLIPVTISLSLLLFNLLYNNYLRENYGSIFLNNIKPAESTSQFFDILSTINNTWTIQYFTKTHYIFLLTIIIAALVFLTLKKVKIQSINSKLLFITLIIILGNILFFILMVNQFKHHDYYFLDTFYLPIILLLIFYISATPKLKSTWAKSLSVLIIIGLSIPLIISAEDTYKKRRDVKSWNKQVTTVKNFKDADKYLDSLHIPLNAKILVIDAYAPNIPFLLMNRKGYAIMTTSKTNIKNALGWDYDYIVTQNDLFFSDIYLAFPQFISQTKLLHNNRRISISKRIDYKKDVDLKEYLGLNKTKSVLKEIANFDTTTSSNWLNISTSNLHKYSGKKSGIIKNKTIIYSSNKMPSITSERRLMYFHSYFLQSDVSLCKIAINITSKGTNLFYKDYDITSSFKYNNKWEKTNLVFQLPKIDNPEYKFEIIITYNGKGNLYVDDIGFELY